MDKGTVSAEVEGPLNAQWTPRLSADGSGWHLGPQRAMIIILMISRLLKTVMAEADLISRWGYPPPLPRCVGAWTPRFKKYRRAMDEHYSKLHRPILVLGRSNLLPAWPSTASIHQLIVVEGRKVI